MSFFLDESLPDVVFVQLMSNLDERESCKKSTNPLVLRMRLVCDGLRKRITMLLSDERTRRAMSFQPTLFVPRSVSYKRDFTDGVRRMCAIFNIQKDSGWSLVVKVRAKDDDSAKRRVSLPRIVARVARVARDPVARSSISPTYHTIVSFATAAALDIEFHCDLDQQLNETRSLISMLSRMHRLKVLVLNGLDKVDTKSLTSALVGKTRLTKLVLRNYSFRPDWATCLTSALSEMSMLQSLSFEESDIGAIGVQSLVDVLEQTSNLTSLQLVGNEFGSDEVECIAGSLEQMTNLRYLSLARNYMGEEGMRKLSYVLEQMPSLTSLNLSANHEEESLLDDDGAGPDESFGMSLVEAIAFSTMQLEHLKVDLCALGDVGVESLVRVLVTRTDLRTLSLASNYIAAGGMMTLAQLTHLTSLDINSNLELPDDCLVPALEQMTNLLTLSLANNAITPSGMKRLAPVLSQMTRLTALDIGANFAHEGYDLNERVDSLVLVLSENTNLITLSLGKSDICDQVIETLAPVLHKMTRLTSLDINENQISVDGLSVLLHSGMDDSCLRSLRNLDISCNWISHTDGLVDALNRGALPSLTSMDIRGNHICGNHTDIHFPSDIQFPHEFQRMFNCLSPHFDFDKDVRKRALDWAE
jgi:Ran GTPase-activating protein (RanGAP) involved in mRNA processing and transport